MIEDLTKNLKQLKVEETTESKQENVVKVQQNELYKNDAVDHNE